MLRLGDRLAMRLYRLFLYMYPAAFRAEYGRQLVQHFSDRMREERRARGLIGSARVWLETGIDLLRSLHREWLSVLFPTRRLDRRRRRNHSHGNLNERLVGPMSGILSDLRYALRTLRKEPGFTLVAILTLGLGIGANSAIFSVVNGLLLRPLPYPDPDRIVVVWERSDVSRHVADPNFRDWRARAQSFAALAVHPDYTFDSPATVLGGSEPARVYVANVSHDFFAVFQLPPLVGRTFSPQELEPGGPPVAVVSHRFWQRYLGGERDLSGLALQTGARVRGASSHQVIGVMPPGFHFPEDTDVWVPAARHSQVRTSHYWAVVGRLADGASLAEAQTELDGITAALKAEFGNRMDAVGVTVRELQDQLTHSIRQPLNLLMGSAGLLLLVACTNLASALLARGTTRQRELSVRAAMGASRSRVIRFLLAESLVLTAIGAVAGVLTSVAVVRGLVALAPPNLTNLEAVTIDVRVIGFGLAVALVAAVAIGLYPAWRSSRSDVRDALRGDSRGIAGDHRRHVWKLLVGGEIGMALLLLVGSGLLIKSFWEVMAVDPGFDPQGVVTATLSPPSSKYPDDTTRAAFYQRALEEIAAIPGVSHAGFTHLLPLSGMEMGGGFEIEGGERGSAMYRVASGDYFAAMGIPILEGRTFDERDHAGVEHAVLVNKAMADRAWPNESPVGKRIRNLSNDRAYYRDVWLTIVGVVGNVRHRGLTRDPPRELYVNYRQRPRRAASVVTTIKTTGPTAPVIAAVRDRLRVLDPYVPTEFSTIATYLGDSVSNRRFTMLILGAFAAVGLSLAMVGIYGVVSYSVAQRTREMGIRVALGAEPGSVRRLVQRNALAVVSAGVVLGVAGAIGVTRVMRNLLFGVSPTDPITFAGVVVLLFGAAWLASYVPARRATRVDPMITMRAE